MGIFAPDLAIDLGSSNTLIYTKRRNVVISEPTLVVASASNRHIVRAVGDEALSLLGRTTDTLVAIHPVKNGVLDDFDSTEVLVRYFIRKAIGVSHLIGPKVLVAAPSNMPAVNRKALQEAVVVAGARKKGVYLVDKPLCAALGANLPVGQPMGTMVVDIGGGTTDIAVLSMNGVVVSQSIPVGGNRMDEAIVAYLKKNSSMLIGVRTAERVKIDLGSAIPQKNIRSVKIRGRDLYSAHAMDVEFTSAQTYEALKEPCAAILAGIKWVLERTPPELTGDIFQEGIHLTGGGSQLFGLEKYIADNVGIKTLMSKDPAERTIAGLGMLLDNEDLLAAIIRKNNNE